MNSNQAKVDLSNSGQPNEARMATDKLEPTNKQHAKKYNVKPDSDKKNESGGLVQDINEKYTNVKHGNLVNFRSATKSMTLKSSVKNSTLESAITSSPVASSSLASAATKSHKLVNSDSGIDSTGTDVSTGTLEDSSSQLTSSNTPNKRSASNQQITNGSLSESMTSADGPRTLNSENLSKTNLYIRGLPASTTDEDLYNMCSKYGSILSTKAIFDKSTGSCRGYGFVQYTSPQSAELAVIELNKSGTLAQMARLPSVHPHHNQNYAHHQHQHQTNPHINNFNHNDNQPHYSRNNAGGNINLNNSLPIHESHGNHQNNNHADPTNLYIANLPLDMSEDDLGSLLSTYGPVISTRILRDERNMTRGVGFARMETRDKCQEVIEKLNGKPFKGSKEPLLIKFADGGNRKRHHYQNNHHNTSHHHHHHQHHHQKYNHEDHRWMESSYSANPNNVSNFEQHGNISHNNQIPDISMMGPLSYQRMPQPYPPNMNPSPGYPATPGSQAGLQWIHPGQPWNVIPQQMIQSAGLGGPNQAAAAAPATAYPYAHIPQLTSQMQGLQIAHHPGAHMGGYIPTHHQWPLWPQPVPQQQPSMRLGSPQQNPTGLLQHQSHQVAVQPNSESSQAVFVGGQEGPQDVQQKQSNNPGERAQISTPIG